jgi:hypothetical protein
VKLALAVLLATAVACAAAQREAAGPAPLPIPSSASVALTACDRASGRQVTVGAGGMFALPSQAAAAARRGDVIRIAAGDYRGDVATWAPSGLTICGIGGRARLFADGRHAQGKAIWVIAGDDVVVDGVEFHDAKVPDRNGAGIRSEGRGLTILNCGFYDNENGLLGGSTGSVITIDRSEFARNGFGDGRSHNIYVGRADKLLVTSSFFHGAKVGHNFKTRAAQTRVEGSYFMDGRDGTSSYLFDASNGGAVYLRGNLFHKGPKAESAIAIAYGREGLSHAVNTLELVHNTIVMTRPGGAFVHAVPGTQWLALTANLLAGVADPAVLGGGAPNAVTSRTGNVVLSARRFPRADDRLEPNFWPDEVAASRIVLSAPADASYAFDAPRPLQRRTLQGPASRAGALQGSP